GERASSPAALRRAECVATGRALLESGIPPGRLGGHQLHPLDRIVPVPEHVPLRLVRLGPAGHVGGPAGEDVAAAGGRGPVELEGAPWVGRNGAAPPPRVPPAVR